MDDIEHRLKRLEDAFGKKIVLEAAVAPSESDETTKDHQQTTDKMNNGRQIKAPKPAAHKPTSAPYDATACLRYDPQEDPFDSGRFAAGETTGQNTAFCPWRSVLNYPHNFVGKGNKENVCSAPALARRVAISLLTLGSGHP